MMDPHAILIVEAQARWSHLSAAIDQIQRPPGHQKTLTKLRVQSIALKELMPRLFDLAAQGLGHAAASDQGVSHVI
jgi:hypothetical protein